MIKKSGLAVAGIAALGSTTFAANEKENRKKDFADKVVVITGGARGIGRSCALDFAERGADIAICDIAEQIPSVKYTMATMRDLDETKDLIKNKGSNCIVERIDVRNAEAMEMFIKEIIETFGKIDVIVANAGIFMYEYFDKCTTNEIKDIIDVNLIGVINTISPVIPYMKMAKNGKIIVIGSTAGRSGGQKLSIYSAAKWGIMGFIKSISLELAHLNITANVVNPTLVNTPMTVNKYILKAFTNIDTPDVEIQKNVLSKANPKGIPWIEPQDVSNSVVFLASEQAKNITGAAIDVATGFNALYTA